MDGLQRLVNLAVAEADTQKQYRQLCALSGVLDATNQGGVKELDRVDLHHPPISELVHLSRNEELRVAQAARYARRALLGIPSNESKWKGKKKILAAHKRPHYGCRQDGQRQRHPRPAQGPWRPGEHGGVHQ